MNKRILLIEDEVAIADTVVYALQREGFVVSWHTLGRDGLAVLDSEGADLLVLDVGLPDISGFELFRQVRQHHDTPVLFLTARGDEIDRVVGLELGADDYVVKPFSPRELVARIKAILRRGSAPIPVVLPNAGLQHDAARARICLAGQVLNLTRYEYRLLVLLLEQPERVFSRSQLMDAVWQDPAASFERTVDAHIRSLRAKLREADPACDPIRTHRGLGYSLSWTAGPAA
ncbi:two-component system response regulator CreB [Chitinimonas arctica]|uniref:Two-component system response regulator CreB n=1 Tax=Chitinimonas arctica TaxID=2594795 RepID=A0A516SGE7_9NEIS|nr:two-component system response regulator CreB [Chitinimonas arctica]QDQ27098.1 two-component system response regulator CreB [Chitinimonas arctica]